MDSQPKNRRPAFVSLGFGLDGDACIFLSNWAGKIVNGSPAEEVSRERPIVGREPVADALTERQDLLGLPVIVNGDGGLQSARNLLQATPACARLADVETLETLVGPSENDQGASPYVEGLRTGGHRESSLDEARVVAGRLYWAVERLPSNDARLGVVEDAVRVTQS